jgi:hypothetical protein
MGEDANETGLHRLTWFSAHDVARNGRNGTGAAGRALCRGKLRRCAQAEGCNRETGCPAFHHLVSLSLRGQQASGHLRRCYSGLDVQVYAKSAGLLP